MTGMASYLAGLALAFATVPAVEAAGRTEVVKNIPDVVVGFTVGSCDGFDILSDWAAVMQITLHYDKDGSLVRQGFQWRVLGQSRYYSSADPTLEIRGGPGEAQAGSFDFVNGTVVYSGNVWKIRLPGYGAFFHETGRTVLDLATFTIQRDTGKNQFNDQDFAALCEALTP